jgi:ADP-heptose:LPS heptosyltransferase
MLEKIEYWWRHRVAYPFLRLIFHNPRKDSPIDIQTIKSILILRYDRIGDMIVTTPVFKTLKASNSNLRIGVFASKANAEIIKYNPNVDVVHILSTNWWELLKEIRKARKENYDVVLNLIFNRTSSGGILSNVAVPNGIKIGQGAEKYRFYFNRLLNVKEQMQHIVITHAKFIEESFGIDSLELENPYEIFIDGDTQTHIHSFCKTNKLMVRGEINPGYMPYIVFNLSASNQWTKLAVTQVDAIIQFLSTKKYLCSVTVFDPQDYDMRNFAFTLKQPSHSIVFPKQGTATLLELASLIEGAIGVITPDTSIIHFASSKQTPVLAFYSSYKENHEWLPHRVKSKVVISSGKEPARAIPIPAMIHAIDDFIRELEIDSLNNERSRNKNSFRNNRS